MNREGSAVNVNLWYYRTVCLLGFSEFEFWHMRIKKMTALYDEYCYHHGIKKREDGELI